MNVQPITQGVLFSLKKEGVTHAKTWMSFENIILSQICQSQKDKHCMIPVV